MSKRGVLVVDDDMNLARMLQHLLISAGYFPVDIANDGAEAVKAFDGNLHRAVITDLHMPGMNGNEVADFLHQQGCGVKIVLFYGEKTGKDALTPNKKLFHVVKKKPSDVGSLLAAVA